MSSSATIKRQRENIGRLQDRITSLTLENMNLKDEVKKYRERWLGLQTIFYTPGILIQTPKIEVPDPGVLDQIERGKNGKGRDFETVVIELGLSGRDH